MPRPTPSRRQHARPGGADFRARQDAHFAGADAAHYNWTTTDPGFAPVEDALLAPYLPLLDPPCLEVGCGEGTNLTRLVHSGTPVGVDRSLAKARFAARAVPGARLLAADATALPFATATFASVFVRDLLHHLEDPALALTEAGRVLRPGGTLVLLEPNGRNPLIRLQAVLVAAERGSRRFSPDYLRALLAPLPFARSRFDVAQAFPLRRLLLHYRFGVPALGRRPVAARFLAGLEALAARIVPATRWSYLVAIATRA
jgi:SAM-dependent methyltransferase